MPSRPLCRFNLLTLLIVTFVIAVALAFVPWQTALVGYMAVLGSLSLVYWAAMPLIGGAAFVAGNRTRLALRNPGRSSYVRIVLCLLLIAGVLSGMYFLWTRDRCLALWADSQPPHSFPYPDKILELCAGWLFENLGPPPPPGYIRSSGTTAMRLTFWTVEASSYLSVFLVAFVLGVLLRADWLWRLYRRSGEAVAALWRGGGTPAGDDRLEGRHVEL